MSVTIIYGPQGSGKTIAARALLGRIPGARRVVEEWHPFDSAARLRSGDIVCTNVEPPYHFHMDGLRILHVDAARALAAADEASEQQERRYYAKPLPTYSATPPRPMNKPARRAKDRAASKARAAQRMRAKGKR